MIPPVEEAVIRGEDHKMAEKRSFRGETKHAAQFRRSRFCCMVCAFINCGLLH